MQLPQALIVSFHMQPLVNTVAQVIGGPDVELPHRLRFPRCKRFWIHRFDIGIGEQAKHLQPLLRAHFFRKRANSLWIENIAAQSR